MDTYFQFTINMKIGYGSLWALWDPCPFNIFVSWTPLGPWDPWPIYSFCILDPFGTLGLLARTPGPGPGT